MIKLLNLSIVVSLLFLCSGLAFAAAPNCAGPNRWATNLAFSYLKDEGLTDNERLDFTKTKVVRLASEKVGKDLYRQIHLITFTQQNGEVIEVITNSDASHEECSMSDVQVYVISKRLGEGRE